VKRLVRRTVATTLADGTVWKLGDAAAKAVSWKLDYHGLTSTEVDAVTSLFEAAEGRLRQFTFVDPTDNLLGHSEALAQAPWTRDPMIEIAAAIQDPVGSSLASRITNNGQADQKFQQTIDAPAQLQYCFSFYVRSDYATAARAVVGAGATSAIESLPVTRVWSRVLYPVQLAVEADSVTFGVVLDGGLTIDVFGMQVEAQAAPSKYKPTYGQGGVYPRARFDEDEIAVTADGPGRYSCSLRIVAGLEG
jgi:hypothetical protein